MMTRNPHLYHTGLFAACRDLTPRVYKSRRFTFRITPEARISGRDDGARPCSLSWSSDGRELLIPSAELLVEAGSQHAADYAVNLLCSAWTVTGAAPAPYELAASPQPMPVQAQVHQCVTAVAAAAQVAARATRRRDFTYALIRLAQSFVTLGIHWMDLHPEESPFYGVSNDPFVFARVAQALTLAHGAIEELGLKIKASQQRPSKIEGEWNPPVLDDLNRSLSALSIDTTEKVVWLVRSRTSRIAKKHPVPPGAAARCTAFGCRDRHISLQDAIHYAELLRSRMSAHKFSSLSRSLNFADAANVQYLARTLLYGALRYDPVSS